MNYRPLGRTGLRVSELCFGTMTFGGEGMFKAIGSTELTRLNATSALSPEYPGWMITVQARDRLEAISQEKRFAKVT